MTHPELPERPSGFRGAFRTDLLARAVYAEAAGIAREVPVAVAVPESIDDLVLLLETARGAGATLIPRGSGSSMAGGAIGPGIVVDLSRWRDIDAVDHTARRVTVGPGVLRAEVDAAAHAVGLRFPVDPSSGAFCTIGGMVATNAAGARSLGFGATRRWVQGIACVFADGTSGWVRRGAPVPDLPIPRALQAVLDTLGEDAGTFRHRGVVKESSGYGIADAHESGDLVDLLVGSEGTLALFTAIELSLLPVAARTTTILGGFPGIESAADAAVAARAAGAVACELLEETFLEVATQGGVTIPSGARAVLLAEVDGDTDTDADSRAQHLASAFRRHGATTVEIATDAARTAEFWSLRHAASPILATLDPSLTSMQFIEDGCVPPDHFASYVAGVRMALAEAGVRGVLFGHAGDAHLHVNPLIDVRLSDWRERIRGLLEDVTGLVASLGGTIAGEHGDGRLRAPLLDRVWSPAARSAFAALKQSADPDGVLNAGAKVSATSATPWSTVKYDPAAPPLPGEARALLHSIERSRSWQRFRLDGLVTHGEPGGRRLGRR
jgi:FAD/FMN-containing dehydrogenase